MNEEQGWGSTLGRNESLLGAPSREWGSILSSQKLEKIDPVKDLGEFAAKSDAQAKETNALERKTWGKLREEGLKFTEPVKIEAGMPPILKGKFPRNEEAVEAGSSIDHEWVISAVDEAAWSVGSGTIHYLNESRSVVVPVSGVVGEVGTIYIHVTRDPASRAVLSEDVEFFVETPISSESDQYFELGYVGGTPRIVQKQFTPIRVYEDLFVINGEFRHGSIAMFGDNLYELPAP